MTYEPEPMTPEMVRVMQDWHDGRNSMFFKVSIGVTEAKRIKPIVKKQFSQLGREARQSLSEMTDETAKQYPQDVTALQSILSWATRQNKIIGAREDVRCATLKALEAGMTTKDIVFYVQDVVTGWAAPCD